MPIPFAAARGARARTAALLSLIFAMSAGACQRSPGEPTRTTPAATPPATQPAAAPAPNAPAEPRHEWARPSGTANVQGAPDSPDLVWDDPPGWQRTPPASPMRRAQYRVPRAPGDSADAELVVITFGPGQGGDTDANLERWYGQVAQSDGRPTRELATRRTIQAGSLNVTVTEVTGRLGGGAMPGMPPAPAIERGRLLAAIVETPTAPWFFKMTGPDATVAAARPAFEMMLRSLRTAPAPH